MNGVFVLPYNPYLDDIKTRVINEITMQTRSDTNFPKILKKIAVDRDD
jgi:hypothetical protein